MIARDWGDVFIIAAMLVSSGALGFSIGRYGWRRAKHRNDAKVLATDDDEQPAKSARERRGVIHLTFNVEHRLTHVITRFEGWFGVTIVEETDKLYHVRYDEGQLQRTYCLDRITWVDKERVHPVRPWHETQAADALLRQALGERADCIGMIGQSADRP